MQLVEGLKPMPSNDNAAPEVLSATVVASTASLPASMHWAAVDLSRLAKDLPVETDVARLPLFGLGSGGDASALSCAAQYVSAFSREAAVVVSGAPFSATSYPSAALLAGFKHPLARRAAGPRIVATRTVDLVGVRTRFPQAVDAFLLDCGLVRADIASWIGSNDDEQSILVCVDEHVRRAPQPRTSFSVLAATRHARVVTILLLEW